MSQRTLITTALLLSTALHAAAFAWWQATDDRAAHAPGNRIVQLTITRPAPPRPVAAPVPVSVPAETQAEAEAAPRRQQRAAPTRRAVARPAPPPQAVTTAAANPAEPAPLTPPPAPVSEAADNRVPEVDRAVLQQNYLARVMAHIEAFKQFPALARRRHVEGRVAVSLAVDCEGGVTLLQTRSGPGLLREAARRSVHNALPLPAPPAHIGCPQSIQYAMVYRLRN